VTVSLTTHQVQASTLFYRMTEQTITLCNISMIVHSRYPTYKNRWIL